MAGADEWKLRGGGGLSSRPQEVLPRGGSRRQDLKLQRY